MPDRSVCAKWTLPAGARRARRPARAHARAHHAVAPERDLDVLDLLAHVGVRALEVGEDRRGPLGVARARELLANVGRVLVGERVVPGPHGRPAIAAALVRRAHVAEARAVVEHVVPRRRRAVPALDRAAAQVDVRHDPRAVVAVRLAAPRAHDPVRDERRRRDDHRLGADAERPRGTDRDHAAVVGDVDHGRAALDRWRRSPRCADERALPSGHVTTVCDGAPGPRWRAAK